MYCHLTGCFGEDATRDDLGYPLYVTQWLLRFPAHMLAVTHFRNQVLYLSEQYVMGSQ